MWGHTCKPPERVMARGPPLNAAGSQLSQILEAWDCIHFVGVPTHTSSRDDPKVSQILISLQGLPRTALNHPAQYLVIGQCDLGVKSTAVILRGIVAVITDRPSWPAQRPPLPQLGLALAHFHSPTCKLAISTRIQPPPPAEGRRGLCRKEGNGAWMFGGDPRFRALPWGPLGPCHYLRPLT